MALRLPFLSIGKFVRVAWNTWILPSHALRISLPAVTHYHWNTFDSCSVISTNDGGDGLAVSTILAFEANTGKVS